VSEKFAVSWSHGNVVFKSHFSSTKQIFQDGTLEGNFQAVHLKGLAVECLLRELVVVEVGTVLLELNTNIFVGVFAAVQVLEDAE